VVKRGARSFIEKVFAFGAEKGQVAEFGFLGPLPGRCGSAMGTLH
jgi:hypothetical protein